MIRMTRLHLINWHNFQDDIIEFKDVTYLLGVNAVGKTTIMDAIRYCLTTNKDFNTAGNKKSGRTLLGSVHQKQRAEDSYLRPGHTVSYIGIEFLDESINKHFVISVRVESETPKQDLKGVYQDWYITKPGYVLEDIPYFTDSKNGRKPTSREAFKVDNKGMERAPSQAEARRRICRVLGIGDADSQIGKKFNEVFHMGTSLDDIKDIREFIYTYILPEPEMNIDFLQKDMHELERLQEILQEAQERETLLADINEKIIEAKTKLAKAKVNELLAVYAKYQGNLEEQQENEQLIKARTLSINILVEKLTELAEKEKKASDLLYQAKKTAEENEDNKEMLSLEQDNKENEKEHKRLVDEASIYAELSRQLHDLRKKLNNCGLKCDWDDSLIIDHKQLVEDRVAEIKKAAMVLCDLKEELKDRAAQIRNSIKENNERRKINEEKIKGLEMGIMCYPEEAVLVRDAVNEALAQQSKKQDAKLLCELLYMNDNTWQDAVESYLNTQRFNIIVSPDNYLLAKKVFISLGDDVKGIGLVDTRKIKEIDGLVDGVKYLFQTVESENIYAKRYIDYVMRGVVCCDSSDELEQHTKSITRDRLRFQNYCLQRMGKKDHFIGVDAITKQLEKAKNELLKIQEQITMLDMQKKTFDVVESTYMQFTVGNNFVNLEKYCGSQSEAEALDVRMQEIRNRIAEFKKNPILLMIYSRVSECEEARVKVVNEIASLKGKKQNLESNVETARERIGELKALYDSVKAEYETVLREYPEHATEVERKYQEERKTKKASAIAHNFSNRASQDNVALNNYMNQQLIPLQQKYTATYTCDFPEGIAGAVRYQQEYKSLLNIELERHKEELKHAQARCKERFRKEVLFRMKDDILRAKQQFKQINRVMENLEYGEESYSFDIGKSSDKELGLFYDVIMDKDNQQIVQDNEILAFLAEANKSEIFESQVEDFMSRIMIDVEEHAKENRLGQKNGSRGMGLYVDYRTYLDYDIIVKNSVTGKEVPLSKVSGEGSGGENQAPFYVAICASLLQIYNHNPDGTMRLILLDEAFNNMTSDRIEPMMKMFRSKDLSLQLVLIATAEKATAIIPYCDITYSIVKSGSRNAIAEFERI